MKHPYITGDVPVDATHYLETKNGEIQTFYKYDPEHNNFWYYSEFNEWHIASIEDNSDLEPIIPLPEVIYLEEQLKEVKEERLVKTREVEMNKKDRMGDLAENFNLREDFNNLKELYAKEILKNVD